MLQSPARKAFDLIIKPGWRLRCFRFVSGERSATEIELNPKDEKGLPSSHWYSFDRFCHCSERSPDYRLLAESSWSWRTSGHKFKYKLVLLQIWQERDVTGTPLVWAGLCQNWVKPKVLRSTRTYLYYRSSKEVKSPIIHIKWGTISEIHSQSVTLDISYLR